MTDLLTSAARRLGVPTEASAGPGGFGEEQIWARWPRHRLEVAHDVLGRLMARGANATVLPVGAGDQWRAFAGSWTFTGSFEDAVAMVALHLVERPRGNARAPSNQERRSKPDGKIQTE